MADAQQNSKVIRKNDPDFPPYLDFDKLRTEGIEYLGMLAGKLWTDHNVHDPGITILEALCYAVLDLGYRTNLPAEDILTQNPKTQNGDTNFFTPAEILTCNPLTIKDFRKMLVDLEGVRNAWLEVATDVKDICREGDNQPPPPDDVIIYGREKEKNNTCLEFLNGLYHVYLDLEKDVDRDFKTEQQKEDYIKAVLQRVKKSLMSHRNLCEDFQDVYVLCKLQTGVCAEIELEENADPEKTYISIVEALQAFFSPAPRFYTLQQLLDKGKSMEEIFAGRPHNLSESHGFVDTEEFEQIILRKEVHLSDVFNVIFQVAGVRSVRQLQIRFCRKDGSVSTHADWSVKIPTYHVLNFSTACSGFRFIRYGAKVPLDFEKFEGMFDIRFSKKFLYTTPSPYLDAEIPKGVYHTELEDYYSIQNEFPRVYGIEEGGLPKDAPPARKAQAYQLKAYLLFFDQLLANYLSQLSNIRSLFSLASPKKEQTYFINQLISVPDLQKLLFFQTAGGGAVQGGNAAGSTLVFPVDKNKLLKLKEQDQLKNLDIEAMQCQENNTNGQSLSYYTFSSKSALDVAVNQLKDDFLYENFTIEIITKSDNCVYFYILSSSEEIALLSKKYFPNVSTARHQAASIPYIGSFEENYHTFPDLNHQFSFTLELNLASFANYLQLMVENRDLYTKRRQGFLNHLLARFAEVFTDYTILSYNINQQKQFKEDNIQATERFLTRYDEISSERGKGYDYHLNAWKNENVSGFEKRSKALAGMENCGRHSLCNFEVIEKEDQFEVKLSIADQPFFTLKDKFYSPEEGQKAAQSFFALLADRQHYQVKFVPHTRSFAIKIQQNQREIASFRSSYTSEEEAWLVVGQLHRLFVTEPLREDVFISQYVYTLHLLDHQGNLIRISEKQYDHATTAHTAANQLTQGINDAKRWHVIEERKNAGELHRLGLHEDAMQYLNLDAFKIDINDNIIGKPDKFTYELLDKQNRFKYTPIKEFDDAKEARVHWEQLLLSMAAGENYEVRQNEESGQYALYVLMNKEEAALSYKEFNSEDEAWQLKDDTLSVIRQHIYELHVHEAPYRWKFEFYIGIEPENRYAFESEAEYESEEDALIANDKFRKNLSKLKLKEEAEILKISSKKRDLAVSPIVLKAESRNRQKEVNKSAIKQWMEVQAEVSRLLVENKPEDFETSVALDDLSQQGSYVYRLINKDEVPAVFSDSFATKEGAVMRKKELAKIKCEEYSYLDICLGGAIFSQRKDKKTGISQYHFQLKSLHLPGYPDQELVLFESIQGYASQEEAEAAFRKQYLQIIQWASDLSNYGAGKFIVSEAALSAEDSLQKESGSNQVFVPISTINALGGDENTAFAKLVKITSSYPIRLLEFESDLFYQLFPCEEKPERTKQPTCLEEEKKYVYYFRLLLPNTGEEEVPAYWQSTQFYSEAAEAQKAFHFFLLLLCYPDNMFVDCDVCDQEQSRYRIYIREILAESSRRFNTEAEAWGKEGVQKFVCVSQSKNAFHLYQRPEDCCYSFYVACAENLAYHPCKYPTAGKRDEIINRLYQEIHQLTENEAFKLIQKGESYLLTNAQGQVFARLTNYSYNDSCAAVPELVEKVAQEQVAYVMEENGEIHLIERVNGEEYVLAISQRTTSIGDWKKEIEDFACYYPIVKTVDEESGRTRYCIEIKLPSFNTCAEDKQQEEACLCREEDVPEQNCYIAWKSRCCYDMCDDALADYRALLSLLLDFNSYQALLDCSCYEFGIALHYLFYERNPDLVNESYEFRLRDSEIVAVNPQCYSHTEMLCEATERAWKLINSEGLHVVEHILLRPRQEEDCRCEEYNHYCENQTDCEFTWTIPEPDPCDKVTDICFIPGADPYSFIATVALPAWPLRFRKVENRQLLENMLYREAPAHVLLRILWLAPHDFCCFEKQYKKWGRWLAKKKSCVEPFSTCEFLEFLFNRNYECLEECDVCLPCPGEEEQEHPCFAADDDEQMIDPNAFLRQVNDLYCWKTQYCGEYEFNSSCEEEPIIIERRRNEEREDAAFGERPPTEKAANGVADSYVETKQEEPKAQQQEVGLPPKPKAKVVNGRLAKYRRAIEELTQENDQEIVAKAQLLIKDPHPSGERVVGLFREMMKQEPEEGKLNENQQVVLIKNVLGYFLDKLCFEEKEFEQLLKMQETIYDLKQQMDMQAVYQYWNGEEVKAYEEDVPLDRIKELLTGKS